MKNITVAVDEATYSNARVAAAKRGTSVSQLVREFLSTLEEGESHFERLKRQELEIRENVKAFSASDRLSREDVHKRR